MSKRLLCGVFILILLAFQSSCILLKKGGKKGAITTVDAADTTQQQPHWTDTAQQALLAKLDSVWQKPVQFSTFSGKAKMHYEGREQRHDFTAHFRIKSNEIIWASITAMGGIVQVARVYITPDSFRLINYLEKKVTEMPLAEVQKILPAPADFSTLQNLIVGTVLKTNGHAMDAIDLGNILSLRVEDGNFVQQINYNKADTTINTLQMRSDETGGISGAISFNDYQLVDGNKFAMNRYLSVVNAGEQYQLDMSFIKAEFDQPLNFPFSVPKSYLRNE